MNFPPRSALRLYSVMPWASTRIVRPSLALDAVFTIALDGWLLVAGVAGVAALEVALVVFELLPQPASAPAAASTVMRNFKDVRTVAPSPRADTRFGIFAVRDAARSEEHTSELQSR